MKKKWLTSIAVTTMMGALITGCGQQSTASKAESKKGSIENQLVIAGNGAEFENVMRDDIFKQFQEKYPEVKISYVSGVSGDIVAKVRAQKASPQIDFAIVDSNSQEIGRKEGLWQKVDKKDVPNLEKAQFGSKAKDNSGVPVFYSTMGISYNKELVHSKGLPVPKSWNDLNNPKVKENLVLSDISNNFGRTTLIMLAYANGGSEKNIDPGFEKYAGIASGLPTFLNNTAQIQQALQQKRAAYTVWNSNRSLTLAASGTPMEFVIPKEGTILSTQFANLVKGAPHTKAAKKFIDFLLTDEVQKTLGEKLYLNPVTDVKLSAEASKKIDFDKSKAVNVDTELISNEYAKWVERFNKEVATKVNK
ncbi:ABC transporter substrate-binding protein [Neobacillus cucumis]|uniref:ABC transporter substrate-binding protein n=1 Tax=Neobacillus cucumis TaxID=1740721 RepID=UPI0019657CB2|nr:ABC transporter substrate-binding protein [Neobacillus cucumis]MBM7652174.1 putative spermidine/putrescine transport system substrate-binding protein [Neobacillus cucumis]